MLPEEYTGLMTNIMTTQLTMPSRHVCQEKNWKVGLLDTGKNDQPGRLDKFKFIEDINTCFDFLFFFCYFDFFFRFVDAHNNLKSKNMQFVLLDYFFVSTKLFKSKKGLKDDLNLNIIF